MVWDGILTCVGLNNLLFTNPNIIQQIAKDISLYFKENSTYDVSGMCFKVLQRLANKHRFTLQRGSQYSLMQKSSEILKDRRAHRIWNGGSEAKDKSSLPEIKQKTNFICTANACHYLL